MLPFSEIEFACLGAAAIIDTALLLALIERRNWRQAPLPVVLLVLGAWLWHAGGLVHLYLRQAPEGWPANLPWGATLAMTAGLLLIPSAMLHGVLRLYRSGLSPMPRVAPGYASAYLPLLLLIPIGSSLAGKSHGAYLSQMRAWVAPYALWLGAVNSVGSVGFWRMRRRVSNHRASEFFGWMAAVLAGLAIVQSVVLLYGVDAWPRFNPGLALILFLSPLLPAILFGYFVSRFNVMRLVLERTVIYGAAFVALALVHQILFVNLWQALHSRYRIDLGVVEAVAIVSLVLAFRPFRRRAAEALRYLIGARVDLVRARLRQVSLEMSAMTLEPTANIFGWFATSVGEAVRVGYVAGWLFDEDGRTMATAGSAERVDAQGIPPLLSALQAADRPWCTRRDAPTAAVRDWLDAAEASLIVTFGTGHVRALLVFGRRSRNRDLGEEEVNALVLLAEQLAATLAAAALHAARADAQRRELQNEKLTALGLLASSIAHEVKNPLSSIKTIAAVMAEELTAESAHAEDLRLIIGECDRLSCEVNRLLQFARPATLSPRPVQVAAVLGGALQLVRHVARERGVSFVTEVAADLPDVQVEETALREVFLNLLTNSIEAAGENGEVGVECRQVNGHVVASFRDTGPGVAPEVQDSLFEPFATTKSNGTGLGLYNVVRRVQECGGEISWESTPQRGACFTVRLPCAAFPACAAPLRVRAPEEVYPA